MKTNEIKKCIKIAELSGWVNISKKAYEELNMLDDLKIIEDESIYIKMLNENKNLKMELDRILKNKKSIMEIIVDSIGTYKIGFDGIEKIERIQDGDNSEKVVVTYDNGKIKEYNTDYVICIEYYVEG